MPSSLSDKIRIIDHPRACMYAEMSHRGVSGRLQSRSSTFLDLPSSSLKIPNTRSLFLAAIKWQTQSEYLRHPVVVLVLIVSKIRICPGL